MTPETAREILRMNGGNLHVGHRYALETIAGMKTEYRVYVEPFLMDGTFVEYYEAPDWQEAEAAAIETGGHIRKRYVTDWEVINDV